MRRLRWLAAVVVAAGLASGEARAEDPVIAAAGDIACDPADAGFNGGAGTPVRCRQRATSDLLIGAGPLAAVLPLGDLQYARATLGNITAAYAPTWGRVKPISRPAIGNHEGDGAGYYDYFNGVGSARGPAGRRGQGWYSFDLGAWHLVALNSNCTRVGCAAGSEQERWLRADLSAHPRACTLAYWHHPRFSSGHEGSSVFMQPLWQTLHQAGVDVALTGHSHDYERFAPLAVDGSVDMSGLRQFVVGTGGAFFTGVGPRVAGSEVLQADTFGVLEMTLHAASYEWRFVPERGRNFTDVGTGTCRAGAPTAERPVRSPRVRLAGAWRARRGIVIRSLTVSNVMRGHRVEVRCLGRRCPPVVRLRASSDRALEVAAYRGRVLPAGTRVSVRVIDPRAGVLGRYVELTIVRGRNGPRRRAGCLAVVPEADAVERPC